MRAQTHPQERSRLAALQRFAILDTPKEKDFDEIVAFAAAMCGTPAAQINLIDRDRQWSKAEVGVGVQTIPLDVSLCAHAILEESLVEIEDLQQDRRTHDNPAVAGAPHVRFYAGVQLRSKDGFPVGTLCVLDFKPRQLRPIDRHALLVLAAQIEAQLELRSALASAAALRSEMDHRVKNSLQSVNAYVRLQRSAAQQPETAAALQGVGQQIDIVAALHDWLSQSNPAEGIGLDTYLLRIVSLLNELAPASIQIAGEFEKAECNARVAGSVGTIVNELVANCIKHAFEDNRGDVTLRGWRIAGRGYLLTVQNNGKKAPSIHGPTKRDGLGLAIIDACVRQLQGSIANTVLPDGYLTELEFHL